MASAAAAAPWVLHVDLDQFLAAVEILRHPELAGVPLIVGGRGDPTERAVVSTASYEAREFGVRSGMPLKVAVRRCPEAVLLPVDFPVYEEASARVMEVLRGMPGAVVEVLGWDEAFVGVTTDDPRGYAHAIRAAVLEATDLHCSVGIGDTKVRAKIATDFGKPRGVFELTRDNWFEVMGDRPTVALWGVGSKISQRLASHGYRTVRDLAEADEATLVAEFGPRMGPHYGRLGRGVSSATVDDTPWIARAHGREVTYQTNLVAAAGDLRGHPRPRRTGRRGHPTRGAPLPTGLPQGQVRAVLHHQPGPQARRADVRRGGHRPHSARSADRARGRPPDPAARRPGGDGAARGRLRRPAHHRTRRSECPRCRHRRRHRGRGAGS